MGVRQTTGIALEELTVLVTGSQRGLGLALVHELSARGTRVYAGHRSAGVPAELDLPGVTPVFMELGATPLPRLPDVDYVVNNAGINRNTPLDSPQATQVLDEELRTNVLGTLNLIHHYLPRLAGRPAAGFVNIISALAIDPNYFCATYSASKAALHSLCVSLRQVAGDKGFHVLNVYPTAIDTRLTDGLAIPKLAPAEVARAIVDAWSAGDCELFFQ